MSAPHIFNEAVESCLRTIAGTRAEFRGKMFELQAADAFEYASKAGFDLDGVGVRLDAITSEFGWSPDQRQALISAAVKKAAKKAARTMFEQRRQVDDAASLDGDNQHDNAQADEGKKPKQADILIQLAQNAHLFHTADGSAYTDIRVGEHRET